MPELPEVETIRLLLRNGGPESPSLLNYEITGADLYWDRTLETPAPDEFKRKITSQRIEEIERRGKFLNFSLSDFHFLLHLRMSGDVLIQPKTEPPGKHHRLSLNFKNGLKFSFIDPRKFGRAWLVKDPDLILGNLGPEPLSVDFTQTYLHKALSSHKRQIKPLLMDQAFLAGLGNIYTDEALFLAKIHPLTKSDQITNNQSERLFQSIRFVLSEGIRKNGASIDWVYRGGEFQNYFRIYSRKGERCIDCGDLIERVIVGQRSTFICPTCQPDPVVN